MIHTITWRVALRRRARLLGAAPGGRGRGHAARRTAGSGSPTPRAWGWSSRWCRHRRRAARRRAPGDPSRAGAARVRQRAGLLRRSRARAAPPARRDAWCSPRSGTAAGRHAASTRRPLRLRPAPGFRPRRPGRGNGAPRRVGLDDGGARGVAGARGCSRHAPDTGDRPLLVPLGLLPRAERRPVRARDPRARASRSTRIRRTSARRSSCHPPSSTFAIVSSRC